MTIMQTTVPQFYTIFEFLSTVQVKDQTKTRLVTKDIFEIDNTNSKRPHHINNYTNQGYKPTKKDVLKTCRYKGHMESRGASRRLGDARAAQTRL